MTIDARHPLPGRRPLVVGAARSGIAAARLLVRHGLTVRLCDRRDASELPAAARALEDQGVECRFGSDAPSLLEGCDFVVASAAETAARPDLGGLPPAVRAALEGMLGRELPVPSPERLARAPIFTDDFNPIDRVYRDVMARWRRDVMERSREVILYEGPS